MLDISTTVLTHAYMSWVGNRSRFEGTRIPNVTFKSDALIEEYLLTSMLKPYQKGTEHFYLAEMEDGENRVKTLISEIFNAVDGAEFAKQGAQLSNLLYEYMEIPKATGGEFFVALFDELIFQGEPVRAVGLWKVNTSTVFLKQKITPHSSLLEAERAIDINNIELSAVIINIEESEGFRVMVVDRLTKTGERSIWKDDFLRLRPVEDEYYYTAHRMNATADFVNDKMWRKYSMTRPEKYALLVKIGDYFHGYPEFDEADFLKQIFPEEDNRGQDYLDFVAEYSKAYGVNMSLNFEIDALAKKKYAKLFRVNVKLDKNFGLTVKTSRTDIITRGVDPESGKQFYTVFYDEESSNSGLQHE